MDAVTPTPEFLDIISSYAGLTLLATVSIYAGSLGSLPSPKSKSTDAANGGLADDDGEEETQDRLSSTDAYLFPVIGSAVLLSFYVVFKYLGPEWINYLIGWYFAAAGVFSVWKTSVSVLRALVTEKQWKSFTPYKLLVLKGPLELVNVSLRPPSLALIVPAFIPSALYLYLGADKKPALLTNILSLSFAYSALCLMKLDTFRTGCIMLSGLFVYDIWWVFGTDVMVKVATTLDAPIKLLWPKSLVFDGSNGFSMLGLGDVVIPGIFVSLALRYDLARSPARSYKVGFSKPYFIAAMIAYVLGLAVTVTVMHTFKAAQPALLYLSPACILSFLLTATVRGELSSAWAYVDGEDSTSTTLAAKIADGATAPATPLPQVAVSEDAPVAVLPPTSAEEVAEIGGPEEAEGDGEAKKRKTRKKKH